MILGFCRIIYVCNFMPHTAVKYFGLSCIITQHVQGRLYLYIYLNIIVLFGFMYRDNVD